MALQMAIDDAPPRRHLRVVPRTERPRTRSDCADVIRPCPWVSCKYNLAVDVLPPNYQHPEPRVRVNWEDPTEMVHSCALDLADEGGLSAEKIAEAMGVSDEWVRKIEAAALAKMASGMEEQVAKGKSADRTDDRVSDRVSDPVSVPGKVLIRFRCTESEVLYRRREQIKAERRAWLAVKAAELKELDSKIAEIARGQERTGRSAQVECVTYLVDGHTLQTVRKDTGEVIQTREADSEDLQLQLGESHD